MALKAGIVTDFNNSMAQAIENAMRAEWPNVMGEGTSVDSNPQFKLLCVAVAQGVIRYLKDNPTSFRVTGQVTGTNTVQGQVAEIQTTGTLY